MPEDIQPQQLITLQQIESEGDKPDVRFWLQLVPENICYNLETKAIEIALRYSNPFSPILAPFHELKVAAEAAAFGWEQQIYVDKATYLARCKELGLKDTDLKSVSKHIRDALLKYASHVCSNDMPDELRRRR